MAVISAHNIRSAQQNLAVFSDVYFDPFERQAYRTHLIVVRPICGNNAGLRGTVPLQNWDAGCKKSIGQRWRKWRSSGNKIPQTAAHTLAPLRKHDTIRHP